MSDIHLREWLSDCADEMQKEGRADGARLALRCMERIVDAADAERRAEQAERERDEARAKAEELRRPLLRRVALDAALNGQQATVPPELRFPWESEGDSG